MLIRVATKEENKKFYQFMKKQKRRVDYWHDNSLMYIIEYEWNIIWFAREVIYTRKKVSSIWNVWIDEKYRWKKLWLELVKYTIKQINKKIIYLDCVPSLVKYYENIWFKKTNNYPKGLLDEDEIWKYIVMKININ